VVEERLCHGHGGVGMAQRDEMGVFGESIHDGQYHCLAANARKALIAMSAQTELGTSSGCSKPAGCRCSVLFLWQMEQLLT
jgi:hypothetical protein